MKRIIVYLFALAWATSLYAQTTAEILGTVTDESGSVIPGAKITARNTATGIVSNTTSGDHGQFRFPLLRPGNYEVTIEKAGFAKLIRNNVEIQLTERANIPAQLKVSTSAEVITVTGEVPLINTTNAEVGVNFDSQRIQNLPLAPNSNILNAALSVPGVSQLSGGNSGFAAGGVSFSVNGMRTRSNNFVVDGTDSNSPSVGGLLQEIYSGPRNSDQAIS